jgi:hypothetical protein
MRARLIWLLGAVKPPSKVARAATGKGPEKDEMGARD